MLTVGWLAEAFNFPATWWRIPGAEEQESKEYITGWVKAALQNALKYLRLFCTSYNCSVLVCRYIYIYILCREVQYKKKRKKKKSEERVSQKDSRVVCIFFLVFPTSVFTGWLDSPAGL